jgi:hypothetical protein
VALLIAGCSGGESGGSSGIPLEDFGGFVELQAGGSLGGSLVAHFYAGFAPNPGQKRFRTKADDKCEPNEVHGSPTAYVDVGPTLAVDAGGATLFTATASTSGDPAYSGFTFDTVPHDASYDIIAEAPLGLIGTIDVPSPVNTLSGLLIETPPGEPHDVTFTPDTGADVVALSVIGDDANYYCMVKDDGEFTVPGSVTEAVGANAVVYVENYSVNVIDVNDRSVAFVGLPYD